MVIPSPVVQDLLPVCYLSFCSSQLSCKQFYFIRVFDSVYPSLPQLCSPYLRLHKPVSWVTALSTDQIREPESFESKIHLNTDIWCHCRHESHLIQLVKQDLKELQLLYLSLHTSKMNMARPFKVSRSSRTFTPKSTDIALLVNKIKLISRLNSRPLIGPTQFIILSNSSLLLIKLITRPLLR